MIKWIYGNTLPLVVGLKEVVKTQEGTTTEDYIPPVGSEIEVWAIGQYKKKQFDYTIDGNTLFFSDDGTLNVGTYGIRVTVREPESRNLRSFKCEELEIVKCTDELELGEFVATDAVVLDTATFFWAKGDKGDAFTYDDFTPEQIEEFQKPASDAAKELTQEVHALEQQFTEHENQRIANETQREKNEALRIQAESARHQQFSADHQQAANDHEKELERESAETLRKQSETQRQTNEQQRQSNETQREETFATYEPKIDAKLDMITQEQFNQIFE